MIDGMILVRRIAFVGWDNGRVGSIGMNATVGVIRKQPFDTMAPPPYFNLYFLYVYNISPPDLPFLSVWNISEKYFDVFETL